MPKLSHQIEALLFAAARPLTVRELAEATGEPGEDVSVALDELGSSLIGGVVLIRSGQSAELATAPGFTKVVEKFIQGEAATPLSKPSLETLAIIAHKQPVTKHDIEEIRGIASDQTIKNLLGKGLIEEVGRSPEPGRPVQYGTGTTLLRHMGVASIEELLNQAGDAR